MPLAGSHSGPILAVMSDEIELPDDIQTCDACQRYMTSDREQAPQPSSGRSALEGTIAEPLPTGSMANGVQMLCQPCAFDVIAIRLIANGTILPEGECPSCDMLYWAKPNLNPGGPVGRHISGATHGAMHCTCGRPGCDTTD